MQTPFKFHESYNIFCTGGKQVVANFRITDNREIDRTGLYLCYGNNRNSRDSKFLRDHEATLAKACTVIAGSPRRATCLGEIPSIHFANDDV